LLAINAASVQGSLIVHRFHAARATYASKMLAFLLINPKKPEFQL
jgi:hypothetical protein